MHEISKDVLETITGGYSLGRAHAAAKAEGDASRADTMSQYKTFDKADEMINNRPTHVAEWLGSHGPAQLSYGTGYVYGFAKDSVKQAFGY